MSNTLKSTSLYDETTPVLIVGGGLVDLSTSLFLSWHGISSLLVERHPGTAIHPRTVGFTPRTMELFRSVGIEDAIRQVEPPVPESSNAPLVESLVGQEFDCLQEDISTLFTTPLSPARGSAIAQDVLEPVLRARAEQLGGDLRFGTELVAFEQDEEGITATIRERESSSTRTVRTQFLVAADGSHSGIRRQLGIGQHGAASLFHAISMIFEAGKFSGFKSEKTMTVTEFEQDRLLTLATPAEASNPFRESYRIEPLSEGACRVHFTVEGGNVPKVAEFFMRQQMKKDQPQNAARHKSVLASRT